MTSNDKILIEILKNFSFQNKILTENENIISDLYKHVFFIERKLLSIENKKNDIYKKINDIYYIISSINENTGINNIMNTIIVVLQIIILFKIF
jgi:hypothetical protein